MRRSGWLTWRAERAARPAQPSGTDARPGWVAEALGSLGVSVALLTLTFAARAGGSGGLWAALLTVLALASVLLSRRWNGLTTPLVALVALVVALPSAQGVTEVRPAPHLWGLEPLGLVCMVWALSSLALLPLLLCKNLRPKNVENMPHASYPMASSSSPQSFPPPLPRSPPLSPLPPP